MALSKSACVDASSCIRRVSRSAFACASLSDDCRADNCASSAFKLARLASTRLIWTVASISASSSPCFTKLPISACKAKSWPDTWAPTSTKRLGCNVPEAVTTFSISPRSIVANRGRDVASVSPPDKYQVAPATISTTSRTSQACRRSQPPLPRLAAPAGRWANDAMSDVESDFPCIFCFPLVSERRATRGCKACCYLSSFQRARAENNANAFSTVMPD